MSKNFISQYYVLLPSFGIPNARKWFVLQDVIVLLVPWEGCIGEGERERLRAQRINHSRVFTSISSVYLSISLNSFSATGCVSKRNTLFQRATNYLQCIHAYTTYWSDHFITNLRLHSNPPDKLCKEFRGSFCTTWLPVLTKVDPDVLCRWPSRTEPNKSPLHFEKSQIFFHRNTIIYIWFFFFFPKALTEYYVQSTGR